jgi:hypothetical protein
MASQNLVSFSISPELKTAINTKIAGLKNDLSFAVSLTPEEKREYFAVGNVMLPFMDKAHDVVTAHPEILPGIFDKDEFLKDYQLTKDLTLIASQLTELSSAVNDTLYAANSDTMVESLEIYAAGQKNQDKIPGLAVLIAEMKEFFKKSKRHKPSGNPS